MKKNLGSVLALYPTLAVVVGTFVQEKVNWVLVAHVGIIGEPVHPLTHSTHSSDRICSYHDLLHI